MTRFNLTGTHETVVRHTPPALSLCNVVKLRVTHKIKTVSPDLHGYGYELRTNEYR
jgi:hypothetical protein